MSFQSTSEAVLRHRRRDRRPHRERREQHHIARHLQHDMGEIVDQAHDRLGAFGCCAERDGKEHREHHDLQDFVLRHRVRDRGRDQMGQEFLDREGRHRQARRLPLVGQRAREVGAGLQQIDHQQAEQQRHKGCADEPAHGLGEHAPELGAAAHMGDAADQRCEHQRRNDHLDQAQEQHGDQVDVGSELDPLSGRKLKISAPITMPSAIAIRIYCVNLFDIAYPRKSGLPAKDQFGRFQEPRNTLGIRLRVCQNVPVVDWTHHRRISVPRNAQ